MSTWNGEPNYAVVFKTKSILQGDSRWSLLLYGHPDTAREAASKIAQERQCDVFVTELIEIHKPNIGTTVQKVVMSKS